MRINTVWDNNAWNNHNIFTYTFDSFGNMLTDEWGYWYDTAWVQNAKYTYAYDFNNNSTNGKCEETQNGMWVPSMNAFEIFSNKAEVYYINDLYRYEASWVPFNKDLQSENNKALFYPNPTNGNVYTKTSSKQFSIEVYDPTGMTLLHEDLNYGQPFDISHFEKGIYLIRVTTDHEVLMNKVIKE
jgi:hypothetical protein